MITINVKTKSPYDVLIGDNILHTIGSILKKSFDKCRICIVTDDKVDSLYSNIVIKSLENSKFEYEKYVIQNGEKSKNTETLINLVEFLAEKNFNRNDLLIALGGGVVGDICGFAASTFLRGIKFIQVPTTVLAAVDSSVGGKTAVNLKAGKNLFGTFYQPKLVLCDIKTFDTLPKEVYNDGLSEAVKYAIIFDDNMLDYIGKDMIETVRRSIEIKSEIVSCDEFDTGTRQLLNFGHTFGHSIEKLSNFSISHGSAVAIGMIIATKGAEKIRLCKIGDSEKLKCILKGFCLPTDCIYSAQEIVNISLHDKKIIGDEINLVLPEKIGKCILKKIKKEKLLEFLKLALEE